MIDRITTGATPDADSAGDASPSPLAALEALAHEAGADGIAREAAALAERVSKGRFYVAVVGQFKRGKSTLINAMVEDAILPTGVVPVTAVVTVVRHGPKRSARVLLADQTWRSIPVEALDQYVSEAANPGNVKQVEGIEVFAPSELLASGMCLVDTPGLGSVFTQGTEATHAFIPQIDAALVVLGADPPISQDELELVARVARQSRHIVLVLNKVDRVSPHDMQEAVRFTERVVAERVGRRIDPPLTVSAAEVIEGKAGSRQWREFRARLLQMARESGSQLVHAAEMRGRVWLAERLRRIIDEERDALMRPISESELRIEHLRRCAADAERTMKDLAYLLDAEQNRLRHEFAQRSEAFLQRSLPPARDNFLMRLSRLDKHGPSLRSAGAPIAQEVSQQWLELWRAEEEPVAERLYAEATHRFVALANDFLERLAGLGEPALADLSTSIGPEIGFRVKSRHFYKDLWSYVGVGPFTWIADLFRSRLRILNHTLAPYFEHLLRTNASRIENDFNERVLESRRRLEQELRARLREIYQAAEGALERARAVRASGAARVEGEIERLGHLKRHVEAILQGSMDNQEWRKINDDDRAHQGTRDS